MSIYNHSPVKLIYGARLTLVGYILLVNLLKIKIIIYYLKVSLNLNSLKNVQKLYIRYYECYKYYNCTSKFEINFYMNIFLDFCYKITFKNTRLIYVIVYYIEIKNYYMIKYYLSIEIKLISYHLKNNIKCHNCNVVLNISSLNENGL